MTRDEDGRRIPETAEEFACWINCWGDEPKNGAASAEFRKGYEQAMSDAWVHASRLFPNWLETWRETEWGIRP